MREAEPPRPAFTRPRPDWALNGSYVEGECEPGTACGDPDWPQGGGGDQTASRCLPLPPEGEPCIRYDCAEGLFCWEREESGSYQSLATCERPRQQGEACVLAGYGHVDCAPGLECRSSVCQPACR